MAPLELLKRSPETLACRDFARHVGELCMCRVKLLVVLVCRIIQDALQIIHPLLERSMMCFQLCLLSGKATMALPKLAQGIPQVLGLGQAAVQGVVVALELRHFVCMLIGGIAEALLE